MLGLAYLVGLAPRLREHASAAQERFDLDTSRGELTRLADERRGRQARADALAAELKAGALQLSSPKDLNRRMQVIVDLAGECGLRIAEFLPGVPGPREKLLVVPIKVRGSGGYAAVTRMIRLLHERCPDTAVSSLSLTGTVVGDIPAEFSVEFEWYTQPDGTGGAAASSPAK